VRADRYTAVMITTTTPAPPREAPPSAPTAEQLARWDREHVWHAFTQMQEYEPLLIERGSGAWLVDTAGRRYIDGSASMWCVVHGHRHPRLDRALVEQAGRVAHTTNLGLSNPTTVALARRLVEVAPAGLEKVFFSDDGSTAIEAALKMAFQFWLQADPPRPARRRFVALDDAYHGDTLGAVGVGGVDRFTDLFAPLTFEAIRLPVPMERGSTMVRAVDAAACLARLEALLAAEGDSIAAVVMEPLVQAAGGILVHPPGFLAAVRRVTAAHGVLLILDEVATGFGRTGRMFACDHEGVVPDFLCLAKGLTAGYLPMAATLTTQRVWNAFLGSHGDRRTFFHGHTYGGNPLAAAVALESLAIFDDRHVLKHVTEIAGRLADHLARIARLEHVGAVRQCGLLAGIELVADRDPLTAYPWEERRGARACLEARRHGVLLRPLGDVVAIVPPLCISADELDLLATAVEAGIVAATA